MSGDRGGGEGGGGREAAAGRLRVVVDRALCRGYGNCLDAAPDAFDLDGDDIAVPRQPTFPEADRPALQRAVDRCPAHALHLEDGGG